MTRKLQHMPPVVIATVSDLGRLQTLSRISVLPGDGFGLTLTGSFQMAPLNRGLSLDPVVDFFAFYVPKRHIYGDDWNDFIEQGVDSSITFPGRTYTAAHGRNGYWQPVGTHPQSTTDGYHRIWNEYFRPPTTIAERTDTYVETPDEALFGWEIAHLREPWNTGTTGDLDASDYTVPAVTEVSLYDFSQTQGRLKSETKRQFEGVRYRDVIKALGGRANPDADKRPTLVWKGDTIGSGYDVDGSDTGSLGQFTGRSKKPFRFHIPRWFVPEHGDIWIMACARMPAVNQNARNPLDLKVSPSYTECAGDYDVLSNMPPVEMFADEWFWNGSGALSLGTMPYGMWYNWQAPSIHSQYSLVTGFPWMELTPTNNDQVHLINPYEYDNMFAASSLRHWNMQAIANIEVARYSGDPLDSIYAGT